MNVVFSVLRLLARQGRVVLVLGLISSIIFPQLAQFLKAYLPELVGLLLFVAALRIGPKEALGRFDQIAQTLGIVVFYQIAIPFVLFAFFALVGFQGPLAFAIILMAAAPAIAGGANITLMTGNEASAALRLLVVGTALLPLTVMPVFWILPELGSTAAVFSASARLMVIIFCAAVAAFSARHFFLKSPKVETLQAMDGMAALVMAVIVVGLMAALRPALDQKPEQVVLTLGAAFAANFGMQIIAWVMQKNANDQTHRAAYSIVAGNRNMGLFLTALPVSVTDPILLFIGCYQIPMYLTPLLLAPFYRKSHEGR